MKELVDDALTPGGERCWMCHRDVTVDDESVVVCTTTEPGVIDGVWYPAGTVVVAHEACVEEG